MIGQSDGDAGDLASEVGDEIRVTLDRWSAGALGVTELVIAGGVIVAAALLAWFTSRIAKRLARRFDGAARTALETIGLVVGSSIVLFALSIGLEVLGFSLGPILVLILIAIAALLVLGRLMTNLSSGLLLQVRGAIATGDLVRTDDELGTVHEINSRTVILDTHDGRRVHIPNSQVLDGKIENYSSLGRRRSTFDVSIDSSVEVDRVLDVIRRAASPVAGVPEGPPPAVHAVGLVGKWVVARVFIWHEASIEAEHNALDAAVRSVVRACASEGVSLAGPQWMALEAGALRNGST